MKKIIFLLTSTVFISLCASSCGGNNNEQPQFPPTQVTAYTVKQENASYYIEYPGTVTALNEVELRPEVSGYLTDIYFKDGQYVTKGMKLYAIDQQQYKAAYDAAKANLNKAQQDYDRYKELAKSNAIATQVLEHSLADLKAAESNLNAVETNLRNSNIYAPFNGTIGIS
jgi:RND family efflux transporter MFP subunit